MRNILHEVVPYCFAYHFDFFATERRRSSSSTLCQGEANRLPTMGAYREREVQDRGRARASCTLPMAVGRRSQTCNSHLTTSLQFTPAASVSASTSANSWTHEAPPSRSGRLLHPTPPYLTLPARNLQLHRSTICCTTTDQPKWRKRRLRPLISRQQSA